MICLVLKFSIFHNFSQILADFLKDFAEGFENESIQNLIFGALHYVKCVHGKPQKMEDGEILEAKISCDQCKKSIGVQVSQEIDQISVENPKSSTKSAEVQIDFDENSDLNQIKVENSGKISQVLDFKQIVYL